MRSSSNNSNAAVDYKALGRVHDGQYPLDNLAMNDSVSCRTGGPMASKPLVRKKESLTF
jgi:hypothetical protein